MFEIQTLQMIGRGIIETLYMTIVSTLAAYVLGLPVGLILVITDKEGIRPQPLINKVLGFIVNLLRSVPFVILMISVTSLTRAIVGTTLGTSATIVPLVIASAPYIARLVESSIKEVDKGVIEAARAMGTGTFKLIYKVLIPEAKPSLIVGGAIAITTILGYSAMSGFIGGGGLGDIAVRYGYYRRESDIMLITVAVLIIIVQGFQEIGMRLAKRSDKRI
jgi:Binding-protein-dependent transport system inner membrane component.